MKDLLRVLPLQVEPCFVGHPCKDGLVVMRDADLDSGVCLNVVLPLDSLFQLLVQILIASCLVQVSSVEIVGYSLYRCSAASPCAPLGVQGRWRVTHLTVV